MRRAIKPTTRRHAECANDRILELLHALTYRLRVVPN